VRPRGSARLEVDPIEKQCRGQGADQTRRFLARAAQDRSTLLEGERLVRAYAESGRRAETIFASEGAVADPATRSFVEKFPAGEHLVLADGIFGAISQLVSAAGIAAVIRTPEAVPAQAGLGCLLLEGIQDPGNLGSILRTAVAAGTRQVFLSEGSVFAWAPKVIRAGMGAHFSLSIFENVALEPLARSFSGRIVATAPARGGLALRPGFERGRSLAVRKRRRGAFVGGQGLATTQVRIPMPGPAESLNIAAAAAICLFEQVRQRGQ